MKNWINYITSIFIFCLLHVTSFAQEKAVGVEMADAFRSEGKIYIVVGVVLIILIGVFVMLFRLEKRIKQLEHDA